MSRKKTPAPRKDPRRGRPQVCIRPTGDFLDRLHERTPAGETISTTARFMLESYLHAIDTMSTDHTAEQSSSVAGLAMKARDRARLREARSSSG